MSTPGRPPWSWRLAVVILALTAAAGRLVHVDPFGPLERGTYDTVVRHLLPPAPTSDQVVVVTIDDRTLRELGERWPLSRHTWARFLDKMSQFKPAVVAIDVVFDQPSSAKDLDLAESLLEELQRDRAAPSPQPPRLGLLARRLESELITRDEDRALEEAIAQAGNVILGAFARVQWPAGLERPPARPPLQVQVRDPGSLRMQSNVIVGSLSRFAVSSRGSGGLNILMDNDGLIRRYPYAFGVHGRAWASLAVAAVQESRLPARLSIEQVITYDRAAPLMKFVRPEETIRASFVDVLDAGEDRDKLREALAGRIVFVGVTATGLHEQFSTPGQVSVPGVELHATAATSLLTGAVGRSEGAVAWLGLLWTLAMLSALLALFSRLDTFGPVLGAAAAMLVLHAAVWLGLLWGADLAMAAVPVPAGLIALAALETWSRHAELQRRKRLVEAEGRVTRVKAAFLSTVSHELRTPLTSVSGALKLLAGGALGTLPDKAQSMIVLALRNTERLGRLINDVLDIQKLDAGRMDFAMEELDMRDVVDETLQSVGAFADGFEVTLEVDCRGLLPVRGDPDRLVQVLTNLISNAVKFSPKGAAVQIRGRRVADKVRVEVQDRGPGIPEAFRPHVFERFAQASSGGGHPSGTGLGLSIAQMMVERHGGTVGFSSELQRGTTFFVELPARQGNQSPNDVR